MKPSLLTLLLCSIIFSLQAQQGQWTWMHGDTTASPPGIFGTKGIFDAANTPPGLYEPCEWTDLNYDFWMFGGQDGQQFDFYNTLWQYKPSLNQWCWKKGSSNNGQAGTYGTKGVSSPANTPGARYSSTTWLDISGNLWLFGGYGYDASGGTTKGLNDLWKYDIATNEWTWMHGSDVGDQPAVYGIIGVSDPLNNPGARLEAIASWTDAAGNLWVFGGQLTVPAGYIDDLWKYDITTNEWTWMKGPNTVNQSAVYGVQGIPDPANQPGARRIYSHWKDAAGTFWIFAGQVYSGIGCYNNTWKIHPDTLEWTWMNGDASPNGEASTGTLCSLSVSNTPDSRMENRYYWTDACYRFYTFGGYDTYDQSIYNDMWFYDPATNEWSWVSGSVIPFQTSHYGTQGVADAANHPGYRYGGVPFTDSLGNLWLFGGVGLGRQNDLWKYTPDIDCNGCPLISSPVSSLSASDTAVCEKFCVDFFDLSLNDPISWEWFFEGSSPSTSIDKNPTGICYDTPGSFDVTLITTNANGSDTLILEDYIIVYTTPPFPTITQNGNTLTSSPAESYQWQLNSLDISGATNQMYEVAQSGLYTVVITDSNGCANSATIDVVFTGLGNLFPDAHLAIYPNPSNGSFTVEMMNGIAEKEITIEVLNAIGKEVYIVSERISGEKFKKEIHLADKPYGLYLLRIEMSEFTFNQNIILIK